MTEQESMVEKIRKLLVKAERTTNEAEAEAFFAKAQELMTKWAIDDMQIRMAGAAHDWKDDIGEDVLTVPSTYFVADSALIHRIALANNCQVLVNKQAHKVWLIGFSRDRGRVQMMYTSLQMHAAREARRLAPKTKSFDDYVWKRSFRIAFANRIGARMDEQVKATTVEAEVTTPGVGLAVIDQRQQVKDWMHAQHSVRQGRTARSRHDYEGASAGRAAADRADIGNTGIGGSKGALNR